MSEPRAKYSKQDVGAIYRSYLMREGPQNVGTVDWPKPKPGALEGLKFLSTGVYETIERSTLKDLITGSGGRYYSGMSKNLDYLLVGREAGPAKLKDAETYNITCLGEEEFFRFICEKLNHTPRDLPLEGEEPSNANESNAGHSESEMTDELSQAEEKKKKVKKEEKKSSVKKEKVEKEEKAGKKGAKVTVKESTKGKKEQVSKRSVNVTKSASNAKVKKEPSVQSKGGSRARDSDRRESVKKSKVKASSSSSISSKKASGKKSASESRVTVKKEKQEQ